MYLEWIMREVEEGRADGDRSDITTSHRLVLALGATR